MNIMNFTADLTDPIIEGHGTLGTCAKTNTGSPVGERRGAEHRNDIWNIKRAQIEQGRERHKGKVEAKNSFAVRLFGT